MTLVTRILVPFGKKKGRKTLRVVIYFFIVILKRNLKKFKDNQISVILLYI